MGEKIAEFQVGIEPTSSVTLLGSSNHAASRIPSLTSFIQGFVQRHAIHHVKETVFSLAYCAKKEKKRKRRCFSFLLQNAH